MGRIEEALKRAAEDAAPRSGREALLTSPRQQDSETPFVSAWQFERTTEPSPVDSPSLGPETAPSPIQGSNPLGAASGTSASLGLESQMALGWPQPFAASAAEKLVIMRETNPAAVEQYRSLAARLGEIQRERGIKTVMVASALPGEGKTLTAVNLALTLSEFHRQRVLVIDADFQQPGLHRVFQVSSGSGLDEDLRADDDRKMRVIELTPRLVLFPAGRPKIDSPALLGSERMRQVLADASASFDWVILDSAPVTLFPEVERFARMVDAALLVIDAGRTPYKAVMRATEALGDRLLGAVLNRAEDSAVAAASGTASARDGQAYSQISGGTAAILAK